MQSKLSQLKCIILLDLKEEDTEFQTLKTKFTNIELKSFYTLVQNGDPEYFLQNPVDIDENDVAVIMYTSGWSLRKIFLFSI